MELNPNDSDVYFFRGLACFQKEQFDEALGDLSKAIELDPANGEAWSARGGVYVAKAKPDAAIADLNKAIELDPHCISAHTFRGAAYAAKGELARAIADLTKAIEYEPKGVPLLMLRGVLLLSTGAENGGLADFRRVIEYEPMQIQAHVLLFLTQSRMGQDGKAKLLGFLKTREDKNWGTTVIQMCLGEITPEECMAAAANRDPKVDKEQKCQTYYYIGQLHLIHGDKEKARECFEKCIEAGLTDFIGYVGAKAELQQLK